MKAENIGPRERRKRLVFGSAMTLLGVGLGAFLMLTGLSRWSRLFLFVPFWLGALGLFQARERT